MSADPERSSGPPRPDQASALARSAPLRASLGYRVVVLLCAQAAMVAVILTLLAMVPTQGFVVDDLGRVAWLALFTSPPLVFGLLASSRVGVLAVALLQTSSPLLLAPFLEDDPRDLSMSPLWWWLYVPVMALVVVVVDALVTGRRRARLPPPPAVGC